MRKSISKKTRFEVFKRDSFTCQYCGATPPDSVLELDHIHPVSKGGTNDDDNLLTSCFNCNRGKSDTELTNVPTSIKDKHAILVEKDLQFVEYQKLINKLDKTLSRQVNKVAKIYSSWYPEYKLTKKFKESSVRQFIRKLDNKTVEEAMNTACAKVTCDSSTSIKYFCGICWKQIKGDTYGY